MAHYYTKESLERFLGAAEKLREVLPELRELGVGLDLQRLDYVEERLRFYYDKLVNNYIQCSAV